MKPNDQISLPEVITSVVKLPGVKVRRDTFLREQFEKESSERLNLILEKGPIRAGCSRAELKKKANRIIKERTMVSAGLSFAAGLPGGLGLVATLPADILQFYGTTLRLAQELIYLYGEDDMWCEELEDPDRVTNQFILYYGVMLGATGAAETVRIAAAALAKQALKKLPKVALTKKVYFSVLKSVLKVFGVSLTKKGFTAGVAKAIPIVGGVFSGGITLVSMLPMGKRLAKTLDVAHFDYTAVDYEQDIKVLKQVMAENPDD